MTSNNTKFKQTEIGPIPEEWEATTIPQIAKNFDSKRVPLSSAERAKRKGRYPYYGAAGIIDWVDDYLFDGKYLLVAEDGTVTDGFGHPTLQLTDGRFWVSNHAHVLQCQNFSETRFLNYALQNISISAFVTGAVQPKLNQENLNSIKFACPNKEERQRIVDLLSSLDDKIELNRKMNATLEKIASTLFKKWFVDIGDNLPEGWKNGKLGDEFEIVMGQSPAGETYNEDGNGLPFYQGRTDFGFRFPTRRIYCTDPKRIARALDTLVSVRAPVGDVNMANEECCIGRGVGAVRKVGFSSYTFYAVKSLQKEIKKFDSEGTVFGSINKEALANIPCVIPPEGVIREFESIAETIDKEVYILSKEINALIGIRDSLLPRLMSGKIRANV